ncbi:choice-of-anchor F family protein [Aliiroseovarius sp. PrR006]|uniref:choice-of-anchor F family protein n=1 Tax=Aliiroseovarius sp. PrR006 TaxID=2706883 RepID=UPI0013D52A6D|nr:choice-of-anchor F family protein [Aliiroseovarius sp. PrR006]NDW54250.1 autotransporter outer membrane beta-barrel domain-containing protein [Aliiroseovarius sp. PrR006]
MLLTCAPLLADTLGDDFFVGTYGNGLIFADPDEGVEEPGMKAITFTRTREDDGTFVDPYEVIITDFTGLTSRGEVTNCLMASTPGVYCDSAEGSGKRIKTQITGRDPFGITMRTTASDEYPSVDYFTFAKTSNYTGARMTGFSVELIDENGTSMGELTPENAVLFNLDATAIGLGSKMPEGLFGEGGHEGEIGFFSDTSAGLTKVSLTEDALIFGALTNPDFTTRFGEALLDNTMTPDGLFWDDNGDPSDESALVAWNNLAGGGWTYGTLALPANESARLAELADALGVDVADLDYAPGALVPDDIVAAVEANGLFETAEIEDIRNANLNFTMTVGSLDGGEFTLLVTPSFAPIVEQTTTPYQFKVAGHLDAAANVPYMDLGNAAAYQTAISDLLAMSEDDRAASLEEMGFSFLPAYSSLTFDFSRNQINTITGVLPQTGDTWVVMSSAGAASSWGLGEDTNWLLNVGGGQSSFDTTLYNIGYDTEFTVFSVGAEKQLDNGRSFGVLIGSAQGTADAYDARGSIDADALSIAAFGRAKVGDQGMIQGVIGYQNLSFDSIRSVMGQTATGSTDGSQIFAALKGEYMQSRGNLRFGPMASVEYYNLSVDAFTETGAGIWNLDVGEQSGSMLLGSMGVRGEYMLPQGAGNTMLTGSLAFTLADGGDMMVESGFAGLPGALHPVSGVDGSWVDVQVGFESVLVDQGTTRTTFTGGYFGSFGSDYESHKIQLGLNASF